MQRGNASCRLVATFLKSKLVQSQERAFSHCGTEHAMSRRYSCSTLQRNRESGAAERDSASMLDSQEREWTDDHALLTATMRDVGNLAMSYFGRHVHAWQKEGGTPVSDADIAVDRHLRQR